MMTKSWKIPLHYSNPITLRCGPSYRGKKFVQRYKLTVPCGAGTKSSLTPSDVPSKGNAYDRAMTRLLAKADDMQVPQSLHTQKEELDKLHQQLKDEYEQITSAAERNHNLEDQTLVLEAKLELSNSDKALASKQCNKWQRRCIKKQTYLLMLPFD